MTNAVSGDDDMLSGKFLPGMSPPETVFNAKLWKYQQQALFWMWSREHPDHPPPENWMTTKGVQKAYDGFKKELEDQIDASQVDIQDSGGFAAAQTKKKALHPMWEQIDFPGEVPVLGKDQVVSFYFHRGRG